MTSEPSIEAHVFQPIMVVKGREDGRYDVSIDFGDAYVHSTFANGDWDDCSGNPEVEAACAALDRWIEGLSKRFVIEPAATYHGIAKVECLECGHTTTNVSDMEMWNDLGLNCIGELHETGLTRWTLVDGTVRIVIQNAEGDIETYTKEES